MKWFRIPFDLSITEEELVGASLQAQNTPLLFFLGKFSEQKLTEILQNSSLLKGFGKLGYQDFVLWLDTRDPYLQRLALYNKEISHENLLFEWIGKPEHRLFSQSSIKFEQTLLKVEWLSLQHPKKALVGGRKLLPGQLFHGTGLSKNALQFIISVAKGLNAGGISIVPEFFHNAVLYGKSAKFLSATIEGRFLALCRDLLTKNNLAEISWAVDEMRVLENGHPWTWFTEQQILPVSAELRDYFDREQWKKARDYAQKEFRYQMI